MAKKQQAKTDLKTWNPADPDTILSRDQILNADDLTTEDVDVPEWGGQVRVKGLTGEERDRYEAGVIGENTKNKRRNLSNLRARLVSLAVIDGEGQRLFKRSDIPALGRKSAAALDRVFEKAMELSGMRDEDIDELTENFTDDQSESFISD
jgi:hypothetical protein